VASEAEALGWLQRLLDDDPERGWRAFIDAHTSTLLALIERAGIVDRDEAMEIYVRICERLAANGYAALRRFDPAVGSLSGWLAIVVRRAIADWVRTRVGRRRLFAAVRDLDRFHQRVFELFYWEGRRPSEAASLLSIEQREAVPLGRVFAALERIDGVLTARHRAELVSLGVRTQAPVPLGGDDEAPGLDVPANVLDPETLLDTQQRDEALARVLASLPPEDAVIVSLKFVEGLSRAQIQQFLRLPQLTEHRVRTIVATLRERLRETEAPSRWSAVANTSASEETGDA
jgi:DNA-directed RNA polymerase specialized sigma24 family protein